MCLLEHNGNGDAVLVSGAAGGRDRGNAERPSLCHRSALNHLPKNCFSYAVAS